MEDKTFCIALVHGDRDSHTFQFHFAFLLVHTRIITELVIVLFFLIWGVQRDHCALRESDARTYYYLQICKIHLNEQHSDCPLVPPPAAPDTLSLTSVTEDSTATFHTILPLPSKGKKKVGAVAQPPPLQKGLGQPCFLEWSSVRLATCQERQKTEEI